MSCFIPPKKVHHELAQEIVKQLSPAPKDQLSIIRWAEILSSPTYYLVDVPRKQETFRAIWKAIYESYCQNPSILSNKEYRKVLNNFHNRTKKVYVEARYL